MGKCRWKWKVISRLFIEGKRNMFGLSRLNLPNWLRVIFGMFFFISTYLAGILIMHFLASNVIDQELYGEYREPEVSLFSPSHKLAYQQSRRTGKQWRRESIHNAERMSMANVWESWRLWSVQKKKAARLVWRMPVQSWAIQAKAIPVWHSTPARRYGDSHRIACQTGKKDSGIAQSSTPKGPCAWSC